MKSRNINLDLIRCVAVLSVLFVHFFFHSDYYIQPLTGGIMYLATLLRTSFMVCVPLFLILSGYLMNQKTLSKKYFMGISRVLIIYALSNAVIIAFRVIYNQEAFTPFTILHSMTSFELYSWYIEMYIGLYLLIPFINLIYNNLSSKKDKTIFLLVLMFLTVAPTLFNSMGYYFVPDFWGETYPITYYVLGCYLHEYHQDIKLSALQLLGLFILIVIIGGTFIFKVCNNNPFIMGTWNYWGSFVNTFTACTLFLFLLKLNLEHVPNFLKQIIQLISKVSLPLYLVSWIFDTLVYRIFNAYIPHFSTRLKLFPVPVFFSFIGSFVTAFLINFVYETANNHLKAKKIS